MNATLRAPSKARRPWNGQGGERRTSSGDRKSAPVGAGRACASASSGAEIFSSSMQRALFCRSARRDRLAQPTGRPGRRQGGRGPPGTKSRRPPEAGDVRGDTAGAEGRRELGPNDSGGEHPGPARNRQVRATVAAAGGARIVQASTGLAEGHSQGKTGDEQGLSAAGGVRLSATRITG